MEWNVLGALQGVSPWWWVAFGVLLAAIEISTMSFFLIGPAVAAVVLAVVLAIAPDMPGVVQIALYAVLAIVLTLLLRPVLERWGTGGPAAQLNSRGARMVGRRGKVLSVGSGGEAVVEIDSMQWRADLGSYAATEGADVEVTAADGMTLVVRPPQAVSASG